MIIIGAGYAGLLAANTFFQDATILEAASEGFNDNHKAILRFRTTAISDILGIDFKEVTVQKGIYWNGFVYDRPTIQLANLYSKKVSGSILERSIWNLEASKRYIAPINLLQIMTSRCRHRIKWEQRASVDDLKENSPVISTIPMPLLAKMIGVNIEGTTTFKSESIFVWRGIIPGADVYQTVYFPSLQTNLYRASITGDVLTAEFIHKQTDIDEQYLRVTNNDLVEFVANAFSISMRQVQPFDQGIQSLGKISPIDNAWRKEFIRSASADHGIYSLGRYATWRNILLDDVLKDIGIIKKLMLASKYDSCKLGAML